MSRLLNQSTGPGSCRFSGTWEPRSNSSNRSSNSFRPVRGNMMTILNLRSFGAKVSRIHPFLQLLSKKQDGNVWKFWQYVTICGNSIIMAWYAQKLWPSCAKGKVAHGVPGDVSLGAGRRLGNSRFGGSPGRWPWLIQWQGSSGSENGSEVTKKSVA